MFSRIDALPLRQREMMLQKDRGVECDEAEEELAARKNAVGIHAIQIEIDGEEDKEKKLQPVKKKKRKKHPGSPLLFSRRRGAVGKRRY